MKRTAIISQVRSHLESRLVLNAYILMAMRLFAGVSGFVFWALSARLLPAREVGLASGVVAGSMLLAGLAQLGFGYGLVRHLPATSQPARLLNSTLFAIGGVGTALTVAFLLGLRVWSPALVPALSSLQAIATFLLLVVSTALTQLLGWAFLARRSPVFTLYKNTLQSGLGIVFLIIFIPMTGSYLGVIYAYMLATVLALLTAMLFWLPRSEPGYRFRLSVPTTLRSPFATYALINYAADQFSRAANTVVPLMVVNVLGPDQAAYFFIVWSLAAGLGSLDEAVSSSMFAEGANDPQHVAEHVNKSLRLSLAIAAVVAVGTAVFSRVILSIYGPDYVQNSTLPLILVAVALIPYAVTPIYSTFLRVSDKLGALVLFSAADVGLGVALMYVFMLRLGLVGATLGWLVSRLVVLLVIVPIWRYQSQRISVKEAQNEYPLG